MIRLIPLTVFFLCALTSYGEEKSRSPLCLQEFLVKTHEGDYIVAESMKIFTLIRVRALYPKSIIFEEISGPLKNLPDTSKITWEKWVKEKAPGHSSWSLIEISLEDGKILECYSFSRNTHIQLSQKESLLATLLKCPLHFVALENRLRVGPPPLDGETDFRKTWSPPFIFEGKKVVSSGFDVFETLWPEDGSELGGRRVVFYFDRDRKISFPIWIEIETSHITGKLRVIDSGKNLPSPLRKSPTISALDRI